MKIYEYYENDNYFFIVHELCHGGQLIPTLIKFKSYTEEHVAFLMR